MYMVNTFAVLFPLLVIIKDNEVKQDSMGVNFANAIPNGMDVNELTGWQYGSSPGKLVFETSKKELDKDKQVATIEYTINFAYGGSFNKTGKYLTNVSIEVHDVDTHEDFQVSCKATPANPTNAGTHLIPIGQIVIEVYCYCDRIRSGSMIPTSPLEKLALSARHKIDGSGKQVTEGDAVLSNSSLLSFNALMVLLGLILSVL